MASPDMHDLLANPILKPVKLQRQKSEIASFLITLPAIHRQKAAAAIEGNRRGIAFVDIDGQRPEPARGMFDEHPPDTAPLRRGVDEKPADVVVDQRDEALRRIVHCEPMVSEVEVDVTHFFPLGLEHVLAQKVMPDPRCIQPDAQHKGMVFRLRFSDQ